MTKLPRQRWSLSRPPPAPFARNRASPQATGLVTWWPTLASRGAGKLRDLGGRGLDGAFVGSPEWVSDPIIGCGLKLDGTNDRINCGAATLNLPRLSVAAWIRRDAAITAWDSVTGKGDSAWNINFDGSNYMNFEIVINGSWEQCPANDGLTLGRWTHVVATYDGTTQRVYLDGLEVNTNSPAGGGNIASNNYAIWIGDNSESTGRQPRISFADIRIYSFAISAAFVWQLYDQATRWELHKPKMRQWQARAPTAPPTAALPIFPPPDAIHSLVFGGVTVR